jgi:hypothetical protein
MIKATKKDTGNTVYMRLKKHNCPKCGEQLKVVKLKKVVKAKSKEASNFDFSACDKSLGEKVTFIWYEFKCKSCEVRYTEEQMRAHEKALKKQEKKEKKEQKKAEKKAEKAEAKAAKKTADDSAE